MTTETDDITVSLDQLRTALEPLIRRIIREELARLLDGVTLELAPDSPLLEDLEDIASRKASNQLKFHTSAEVWGE